MSAWLQFFRVRNLFTVPGDVIVGAAASLVPFAALTGEGTLAKIALGALASVFMYMFGLADNDMVGAKTDRGRPIGNGEISLKAASFARGLCLLLALGLGIVARVSALWYGTWLALTVMIIAYNRTKSPWLMGCCRGLNVLCGGVILTTGCPLAFIPAVIWTIYIAAVTKFSEREEFDPANDRQVTLLVYGLVLLQVLALAVIFGLVAPRERALAGACAKPLVIKLKSGYNFAAEGDFVLGPNCSGLVIEGAPDGTSVLTGARRLPAGTVFTAVGNGIFVAACDIGEELPDQLYVKGHPYWMARYPNRNPGEGRNVYDVWVLDQLHPHSELPDALAKERVGRWAHPEDGIVHAMHSALWGDLQLKIIGVDAEGAAILKDGGQNARPSPPHPVYRFVENLREELDQPGEWFYDPRERRLYVKPLPGDDLAKDEVLLGARETLVEIVGTAEHPVREVTIRNVTFRHSARTFFASREGLLRSDWTIHRGAALNLRGVEKCRVEHCTFEDLGGNAVLMDGYVADTIVTNCLFQRIGASAVVIAGRLSAVREPTFEHASTRDRGEIDATPGPQGLEYPRRCSVVDCLMLDLGREEKQVAGVTIDIAADIEVRNCTIARVPRAGINIGDGCFGGHLVTGCDVFETVLETGDHGAFNSWGRDRFWTNILEMMDDLMETRPELVRADCIRPIRLIDNRWRCDHGWDIDLDDGSSFYLIESNVCLKGGLKLREGFRRQARGNFCLNNGLHPHCWLKTGGDVVEDNVFFALPAPAGRSTYINAEMAKNTLVRPGEEKRYPLPKRPWGVKSPWLQALAPMVQIPAAKSAVPTEWKSTSTATGAEAAIERREVEGMIWRRFDGKREFSAYGVTPDIDGWILEANPRPPFRRNDILNGELPKDKFSFPVEVVRPQVGRQILTQNDENMI